MAARGKAPFKPSINKLRKTSWPSHPVTMSAPNFCDIRTGAEGASRAIRTISGSANQEMIPAIISSASLSDITKLTSYWLKKSQENSKTPRNKVTSTER